MSRRVSGSALVALYDQAMQSAASFGFMVVTARAVEPELFGHFAAAYAAAAVVVGAHRSLIALPMLVIDGGTSEARQRADRWLAPTCAFCGVVVLVCAVVTLGGIVADLRILRDVGIMTLLLAPGMVLLEHVRRLAYLQGHRRRASSLVTTFGVLCLAGTAATASAGVPLGVRVGVFGLCFLTAALVHLTRVHLRASAAGSVRDAWRTRRTPTLWHLASFAGYSVYSVGFPIVLAAVAPIAVVAAFAASRLLVTPALAVVTAIDAVDKPRASAAYAEDGPAGLTSVRRHTQRHVLLLNTVYLAAVWLSVDLIEGALLDDRYSFTNAAVLLWFAVSLLISVNQAQETSLIILGRTRGLFLAKAAAAVVAFSVVLATASDLTLTSAVGAVAAAMATNVLITALFVHRGNSSRQTTPPGVVHERA